MEKNFDDKQETKTKRKKNLTFLQSLTSEQYSRFCSRRSVWDWPLGAQTRPHTEYTGWSRSPSHSSSCYPASPPDDCQNESNLLTIIETSHNIIIYLNVRGTVNC